MYDGDVPIVTEHPLLNEPLEVLGLPTEVVEKLRGAAIRTVPFLLGTSPALLEMAGLGRHDIQCIERTLAENGLSLGTWVPTEAHAAAHDAQGLSARTGDDLGDKDISYALGLHLGPAELDPLRAAGIARVRDLTALTAAELAEVPGIDARVLEVVQEALDVSGLRLAGDDRIKAT
jgi:DNA-directed RNA polymerase alpha subunit